MKCGSLQTRFIKPGKIESLLNSGRHIMTRLTIIAAIGVLSATNPLPATPGSEPAGHSHDMENFSAGEWAIRNEL
jgi:hypothetical protein